MKNFILNVLFIFILMALPGITIATVDGALGQQPPENNHVSGLIIYTDVDNPTNKYGVYGSLANAIQDGFTAANTQPWEALAYYHIREFFRLNPNGRLYVYVTDQFNPVTAFSQIEWMQRQADGEIRQFAIHAQVPVTDYITDLEQIQERMDNLAAVFTPAVAVVGWAAMGDNASLADLADGSVVAPNVAACVGAVYSDNPTIVGTAAYIRANIFPVASVADREIPYIGATLGAISKAPLHINIGWVNDFNMTQGAVETKFVSLADGTLFTALAPSTINDIHQKGYQFLRTFNGYSGAYINTDVTATSATSDYNSIRNNRVINEAIRQLRRYYLPYTNAPVQLQATGELPKETCSAYEAIGIAPLNTMFERGYISAFKVYVDPAQNVLATNTIAVQARIKPIGCSSYINIDLGFAATIA